MSSAWENSEAEFARKVCQVLTENVAQLPQAVFDRLAVSRRMALARKKSSTTAPCTFAPTWVAVGGSGSLARRAVSVPQRRLSCLSRFGFILPIIAIAAILFVITSWEDQQHIAEIADIDAAMLSDNLPLSAYLDRGFHAYLSHPS